MDLFTWHVLLAFLGTCAIVFGVGAVIAWLDSDPDDELGFGFIGFVFAVIAAFVAVLGTGAWLIGNLWQWAV